MWTEPAMAHSAKWMLCDVKYCPNLNLSVLWDSNDNSAAHPCLTIHHAAGSSRSSQGGWKWWQGRQKLAPLPKWLCLGNGIFDICLGDKTHHQIWRREGQCPYYQIGMVWHLVWRPVLDGDREALRTRRQYWGGSRIKSLWWGRGEISPFYMSACNLKFIKGSYSNKIGVIVEQNMLLEFKKKKRLSDFLFNCPDIWLQSGEALGIKSGWSAFLVHFLCEVSPA